MPTVTLDLPEEAFSALRRSPEEFARELRLAAALFWYSKGEISQGRAAMIAGLDRTEFLLACAAHKVQNVQVNFDEIKLVVQNFQSASTQPRSGDIV